MAKRNEQRERATVHVGFKFPVEIHGRLKEHARKLNDDMTEPGKTTLERLVVLSVREYLERNEKQI